MDITSYVLGKKAGGGGGATLQEKSISITTNGTTNVLPDENYDGMSKVIVSANVQPNIQVVEELPIIGETNTIYLLRSKITSNTIPNSDDTKYNMQIKNIKLKCELNGNTVINLNSNSWAETNYQGDIDKLELKIDVRDKEPWMTSPDGNVVIYIPVSNNLSLFIQNETLENIETQAVYYDNISKSMKNLKVRRYEKMFNNYSGIAISFGIDGIDEINLRKLYDFKISLTKTSGKIYSLGSNGNETIAPFSQIFAEFLKDMYFVYYYENNEWKFKDVEDFANE